MNRPNKDQAPGTSTRVRGLALPTPLVELLASGRWRHPGDETLREIMPWFKDPLDFLTDVHQIRHESGSLDRLTDDEETARIFRQARGSAGADPVELPYLDVDLAVLIAVNRIPGDDVAVALDYRTDPSDPRVVASDFWTDPHQCSWRTIAPTFSAFIAALNLTRPQHYNYVGPAEILDQVQPGSARCVVGRGAGSRSSRLEEQAEHEREEPFTFIHLRPAAEQPAGSRNQQPVHRLLPRRHLLGSRRNLARPRRPRPPPHLHQPDRLPPLPSMPATQHRQRRSLCLRRM